MASVVVIGGGTMGAGIATSMLVAGKTVWVVEAAAEAGEGVRARVADSLERLARKYTQLDPASLLSRLSIDTDHPANTNDTDLVIEAVPEDLELKQAILTDLESRYDSSVIFASNTSSLSITEMATALEHPDRCIGMHFFNPVPVSELIEIVVGESTSKLAIGEAEDWAERLGKTPIIVNDAPGFASSRLGLALGLEAIRMVEAGVASAEDIDTAMTLGYKHPMGPLRLTDLVGLDVRLAIAEHLATELGDRFEPPALMRAMVAEGKLGKKAGQGFYSW